VIRYFKWAAVVGLVLIAFAVPARADLLSYLHRPEPAARWDLVDKKPMAGGTVYTLHLVSQVWHDIKWEHSVVIYRPDKIAHPETCGLLNTGGNPSPDQDMIGMQGAKAAGCPFAIIFNIPNQPLFGGLTEDKIIAYTWKKFLATGDETWPLHFPMAKAVIKAMDAIQAFTKHEKQPPITGFLITGASKRGWTTWLVGASGDKRVKAIAPMVIDTLNLAAQVPHQLAMYGAPSEEVKDYTVAGLIDDIKTGRGKRLIELEDPYSYRDTLTMPKLIILGSNDPYWSQDSLNLYWDGLKGQKWILYNSNSGHDLANGVQRILTTLPQFLHAIAAGLAWPNWTWHYSAGASGEDVTIKSDIPIQSAIFWHVAAPTQDFRKFHWSSEPMTGSPGGEWTGHLARPESGYAAMYCEATFEVDGHRFSLTSQLQIVPSEQAAANK
jgi:PhoPQ-activated pathogenicity-related protein